MLHNYIKQAVMLLMLCTITQFAQAQEVLHYWHFNTLPSGTISTAVAADESGITGTAAITYPGTGAGYLDRVDPGDISNAQPGIVAGYGLRPRNPSNTRELLIAFPTTGYKDIKLSFVTTRTTQGATAQSYSYSVDGGTSYLTAGMPVTTYSPVADVYNLVTLDLSDIDLIDDKSSVIIKINFGGTTAAGTSGNNRFDNVTVTGNPVPTEKLVHYWHFNNLPSGTITTAIAANASEIAGTTAITYTGTGAGYLDRVDPGDVLNAQANEPAGYGLRPRNPANTRELLIAFPTTGFEYIKVKFVTTRTTAGASEQTYSYSTDGGLTYVTTGLAVTSYTLVADIYNLVTLDFSDIEAVEDLSNVIVKINFGGTTAAGSSGNNRFDNITVHATPMEGTLDTTPPSVTLTPANNTVNVAVNATLQVELSEDVRMADDSAITAANAASIIVLKTTNASGTDVPFTATFANNIITVTPTAALANNQQYYLAYLPNVVEDMNNNAVTETVGVTFTTIAVQTAITAGDLIPVAYRMNATNTEDEIALLSLIDIAPGTFINITDAKYTTNTQAQCPGGIVWTATQCIPAGTVITIQTSAALSNTGTVTGSGFGLSSGGEQVIVYTGTAAAPNYITALSSNNWITANTTCGGNASMLPAGLTDGTSSINLSTATGNVAGNTVNAYYNGTNAGTPAQLKAAVLNPANWTGVAEATAPQTWPVWAFPSAPTVQSATVVNNNTIQLVFNNTLDVISASNTANYTGIAGLTTAAVTGNTVVLTYASAFASGASNTLTVNNIADLNGLDMACAYNFTFSYNTTLSFAKDFVVVNENHGTLNFIINLVNPAVGSVDLVVRGAPFSTADANDFTLLTQTLNFTGTSPLTRTIAIPIIDDATEEQQAEYFVVSLENPVGLAITGETLATIYIKDNDRVAKVPSQSIELTYVRSFDPSGTNSSTCEIVVHDPASQRLFTTSAVAGYLDIINFANPEQPVVINSINMNPYGGVTSVAVKNGVLAVASPNAQEHLDGSVVFFNTDGVFQKQVNVGALPDNISFTPDGTKVLTANEGQPNSDYSIDPEGSVSIIDISGGIAALTQANVTTLGFQAYNGAAEAALLASGVRKLKLTSTMSQDFEPEYITTSADSQKAWVTLQENNAIAQINLATKTITDVWALGTKDMSLMGNGADISDNNNEVLIANWPIKSYYIPDAVASYNVGGTNYIITANEGDEKEYTGFEERTTIGAATYTLDAALFPHAAMLKKSHNAGRMRVTNLHGNTDADADYEQIYSVGTRSFSIFNADTKQIVFDSGDDFEMYTSSASPINALFNSDSESNSRKSRSRAKGPEPEGVTIAQIAGKSFAFISLERVGGVMVYDVTDPNNVEFVDYKNNRSVSAYAGDHGPEGITHIDAAHSPDGKHYIIVANEISGTLTIFEVDATALSTGGGFNPEPKTFVVFPNPAVDGIAYFNRVADIEVYDYSGKLVHAAKQALTIDTSKLASGIYIIKTGEGQVKKLVVK